MSGAGFGGFGGFGGLGNPPGQREQAVELSDYKPADYVKSHLPRVCRSSLRPPVTSKACAISLQPSSTTLASFPRGNLALEHIRSLMLLRQVQSALTPCRRQNRMSSFSLLQPSHYVEPNHALTHTLFDGNRSQARLDQYDTLLLRQRNCSGLSRRRLKIHPHFEMKHGTGLYA